MIYGKHKSQIKEPFSRHLIGIQILKIIFFQKINKSENKKKRKINKRSKCDGLIYVKHRSII